MRSQWEEGSDVDLDAPTTITEREWRGIRRRAGFGVFAAFLAMIAVGGLAWTLYAGPQGLEQVQDIKDRVIAKVAHGSDAGSAEAQAPAAGAGQTADSAQAAVASDSSGGAMGAMPPPPGAAPGGSAETRRASTQGQPRGKSSSGE